MKRFLAIFMTLCFVLGMSSVSASAATIGDLLTQENQIGWTMIEKDNSNIKYSINGWWYIRNGITNYSKEQGAQVKFKFKGTKFRVIGVLNKGNTDNVIVNIDGVVDVPLSESASEYDLNKRVVYEKTGLADTNHTVTLTNAISKKDFDVAAIQIDSTGKMLDINSPDAPINLKATYDNKVNLSWTAVTDATSYNIKRTITSGGIYTTIATTSAITYTDNNVTNGAIYYYVVSAVNAKGESGNSNEVSVTLNGGTPSAKLSVLLNSGENVQLSTSFNLDNNKNFTWSSTNEAVATVDSNGKVIAIAEGTANIYAQNADGTFKEYIPVKVVKGIADELRLAVHLKAGEKAKLYLTDDPSKVTWTSMDESIATIAADGQVTGVKKGLAIVKAELDGQAYQIYVRVNG